MLTLSSFSSQPDQLPSNLEFIAGCAGAETSRAFIKNIGWHSMNLFLLFDVCVVTCDTCDMPHQKNACSHDNLFTSRLAGKLWAKIDTIRSKLMSNLSVVSEIVAS